MTEFPKHWKKGIFHRGEFRKYLKIIPREDMECMFSLKENKENGVPPVIQTIAIMDSFSSLLRKNEKKTVKIKTLMIRYKKQRNKSIIETLKIGFLGRSENRQQVNDVKSNDVQKTVDDLQNKIGELCSKYEKDWEYTHRDYLDKAKDATND